MCTLRRNMSLSKLVQNDYAHEGKPTFAKTRHGPLVMVNNHSTQVFEQHLAMGIRCKTPVWLCILPPWGWKCSKSNSNLSLSVPRGLGDQTNTDAWASLGIAHCPRGPSLPRPRGFAQRHCQFFDWTISMQATQFLLTMSSVDHWIYSCTIIASHLRYIVICKHPLV